MSNSIGRVTSCCVFGAVILFVGSTAIAQQLTLDGLVMNSNSREFDAPAGEIRYFHCSAVILSNGATEGLGAGSSTGGTGLLNSSDVIAGKIVARFNFNGVFSARNDFGGNHTIRVRFENASLDLIGDIGSSSGYLYGTTELTQDNTNPLTENPVSVPVGTIVEVRMGVTLRNGAVFSTQMFANNFDFETAGLIDCSRPKRAGFDADCNGNSMIDAIDIAEGLESDCNDNAIPDSCDILNGTSLDCDNNGVADECDPDCNGNGLPDACDIASGASADCNTDGTPDECEPDCNNTGLPDDCDLLADTSLDCNGNFVPDECDVAFANLNLEGTLAALEQSHGVLSALIPDRYDFVDGFVGSFIENGGDNMYDDGNKLNTNWATLIPYSNNAIAPNLAAFGSGSRYFTAKYDGLFILIANDINISFFRITGRTGAGNLGTTDTLNLRVNDRGKYYDVYVRRIYNAYRPSVNHLIIFPEGASEVIQSASEYTVDELHEIQPLNHISEIYYLMTSRTEARPLSEETLIELATTFLQMRQLDRLDCNENSIPDECEEDCNENSIPDECEPGGLTDCDGNGTSDLCDLYQGIFEDCNNNAVPDTCELPVNDCNGNNIPDDCELTGAPFDVINQAILNPSNGRYYILTPTSASWAENEAYASSIGGHLATVRSAEENQWLLDTFGPLTNESEAHIGLTDQVVEGEWVWASGESAPYTNWGNNQPDNSGNEDFVDLIFSNGLWNDNFRDSIGIVEISVSNDCNENGDLDECEILAGTSDDCNENGIPDECEPGGLGDCDGDGISDLCELYLGEVIDCDNDSVPDACQLSMNDCNANGVPDQCEPDCSNDGVPDACELSNNDCNANGVPDTCELQQANYALDFDGVDDSVRVPRDPSFEPALELTLEAWIRPDSGGSFHSRILRNAGNFNSGYILSWQQGGNGRLQLRIDGAAEGSVYPTDTVPTSTYFGQWHHVAGVYSASGDYARIYVDGVLKDEKASVGTLLYSGSDLGIGNFFASSNEDFDGLIDEVRIWSVARTQTQLLQDMHRSLVGTEVGLVGYWKLNEASGQQVIDSSMFANHGHRGTDDLPQGDSADPAWLVSDSPIPVNDCNQNDHPDDCDIADMTSSDCNSNGIPDECESGGLADCDGNGVTDLCELYLGTASDCQHNGVPDACELSSDCNGNGIPDECDLIGNDCNGDSIPDDCEIAAGADDCNANGTPDACELISERHALHFDGSDYVYVPNSNSLAITSSLTIDLWARLDNPFGASQMLVIKGDDSSGQDPYYMRIQNGLLEFGFNSDGNQLARVLAPIGQFDWNEYHHVVGVFDDTLNELRVYVDGSWLGLTQTPLSPLTFQDTHYVTIGGTVNAGMRLAGDLDEIRIWKRALTPSEINEIALTPLVGNEADLVALWRFNEGAGQTVNDSSVFGNHGRLGANENVGGDGADPVFITETAPAQLTDCNANGTLDECDIAQGLIGDCNTNGIPDDCEPDEDCNANGMQDICDIAGGMPDCNNNLVPDACEVSGNDCNENNVPDICEPGGNVDCDGNGVVDFCDLVSGNGTDCNGNGTLDSCDIASNASTDVNENNIPDDCETEVRVIPVATLINPALTSETRSDLPESIYLVHEGSRYYLEIWVSDVGETTDGLSGVYVDVDFCTTNVATDLQFGGSFDFLPEGTIQSGGVNEFGAATFDAGVAISPEWVRLGWIEMRPGEGSPCTIELQESQNGVGAPGPVDWAFVELGTLQLQVEPTTISYDLNGDGFIGFGDFSLFIASWLQSVPPADPAHDFDCDGFVGPGDLSWFATGWQKNVDDPSILYPVCDGGRGGNSGSPDEADISTALVALAAPSATDSTTTLPTSIESTPLGGTYVIELWVSDVGDVNSGITSAYFDVAHPTPVSEVEAASAADAWPLFDNAAVDGLGMVDELGGSILEEEFAVEPEWTRVGVIEFLATGPAPAATFAIRPGVYGVAAYARGLIPWSSTELSSVTITQGVVGDIDGDNDVDMIDLSLLLEVLTGNDVFGDLNFDGAIDGLDIRLFVQGRLLGEYDEVSLIPFVENLLNAATPGPTARHRLAADMNGDGLIDGGDIQRFVNAIVGQ